MFYPGCLGGLRNNFSKVLEDVADEVKVILSRFLKRDDYNYILMVILDESRAIMHYISCFNMLWF